MEQEISINENEVQSIIINSVTPQTINIQRQEQQDLNIKQQTQQNINIQEKDNQVIYIEDSGKVINITDVLVNGVSVVSNHIAYIIVPTKVSQLLNDSGYLTKEQDPTIPNYIKQISLEDITNWNNKQNLLVSGTNIKTINNSSIVGSGNLEIAEYEAGTGINITGHIINNTITNYDDLNNKPVIPTKVSELENDSNYATIEELSEVAFSGDYEDLTNKPFIPTETSDLLNNSGFIDKEVNDLTYYTLSSNLSSVATSGNYNDLSNKPSIPTVNDATLTIQQNGTTLETFTANASSNKTVNITTPTKTSDLINDSGFITNNYDVYSTTETRIGTWINGKPIYRQVIETTTPSTTSVATIGSVSNLGIVTNLYGLLTASGQQVPLNFIYNTNDIHSIYTEGNNIMCKINYSGYLSKSCFVIIEYTKTTD